MKYIPVGNITEIRNVVQAASVLVCEQLGVKERKKREEKEPYWKRNSIYFMIRNRHEDGNSNNGRTRQLSNRVGRTMVEFKLRCMQNLTRLF